MPTGPYFIIFYFHFVYGARRSLFVYLYRNPNFIFLSNIILWKRETMSQILANDTIRRSRPTVCTSTMFARINYAMFLYDSVFHMKFTPFALAMASIDGIIATAADGWWWWFTWSCELFFFCAHWTYHKSDKNP